jgi:hypothetical protein
MPEGKTLFEILKDVTVDEEVGGDERRPYDMQCAAVVANHKNGGIIVYAKQHCALWWEIQDIGSVSLGDYGLDDAPEGISLWEGSAAWRPGGYECPEDGQMDYSGAFRRLAPDEAVKIADGESLWPEEKDVDEDQRAKV